MTQYCRYCAFCCYGDVPYCTDHDVVLSDDKIRQVNHCKDFALSDLGDVITGRQYSPRKGKPLKAYDGCEQLEIWNGTHGQVVAPVGTFEKIYEEADADET